MIHLVIDCCLIVYNLTINYLLYRQVKQQRKPQTQPPVYQESEIISKAIELQNAYCNAIYNITQRVGVTEEEDELLREVNKRQRNFLYHLRKLNPNYQIIKE